MSQNIIVHNFSYKNRISTFLKFDLSNFALAVSNFQLINGNAVISYFLSTVNVGPTEIFKLQVKVDF